MFRRPASLLVLSLALPAAHAAATTLTGSLTYAGLPVAETFTDLDHGIATAHNSATSTRLYGTADAATGRYEIDGLTPGRWSVRVLLGPEDLGSRILPRSGEVGVTGYLDVGDVAELVLDLETGFAYRITEPFDSLDEWPGELTSCPSGPAAPPEVILAWQPVPLAVRYEVSVVHVSCGSGGLETTTLDTQGTSASIRLGGVAGEDYVGIALLAYSAGGHQLAQRPYIRYGRSLAEAIFLHLGSDERAPHPPSSVFVPQVGRLPGVPPTFWTSDVVLTNPTASAVTAQLVFTPRDVNGLTTYLTATVDVPPAGCRVLTDVVGNLFATTGAGSLQVSPLALGVTARIATPGAGGGSYGQGLPVAGATVSGSGPVTALGVGGVARGPFRSNLVLAEVWGEPAELLVSVLDRDGAPLGSTVALLEPFGNTQLNDVVGLVGGPATLSEGQVVVEVTSGDGRVAAVLSLVDATTGDPTTLALEPR